MKSNQSNIKKAKKYLNKNYCIGVPTETVYGLAANAYVDSAVKRIFNLKKRPKNNPLIVHYLDIDSLKRDCFINDNFIKLYEKFSPGPITYILKLKKNSKISKNVTNNEKNLAIRFPNHKIFKELLKQLDYPLAAPMVINVLYLILNIAPISNKILDLIFFPPGNKPYFMAETSSVLFCFLINFFKNKLVSFAILRSLFIIFL